MIIHRDALNHFDDFIFKQDLTIVQYIVIIYIHLDKKNYSLLLFSKITFIFLNIYKNNNYTCLCTLSNKR